MMEQRARLVHIEARNGDNVVGFPVAFTDPYDELVVTIVQDSVGKKVAIVVSGFRSMDEAVAFLEDE